jgi:hypothetical protein
VRARPHHEEPTAGRRWLRLKRTLSPNTTGMKPVSVWHVPDINRVQCVDEMAGIDAARVAPSGGDAADYSGVSRFGGAELKHSFR